MSYSSGTHLIEKTIDRVCDACWPEVPANSKEKTHGASANLN